MKNSFFYTLFVASIAISCTSLQKATTKDNGKITLNIVQINDVYEIAPLTQGKEGGMARVATIKNKYLQQNPNTFLVMAGDFLSPSVYNSLQYEGKAIRGKQMVDAMNAAGTDIAIFGNHEFDIKEAELQARINESKFDWISSNTFHKQAEKLKPFEKMLPSGTAVPFPETYIKTITDADGTVAKIGFLAVTLPFNKAVYVSYTDVLTAAKRNYALLKDSVDAVIAITHQSIEDDKILAAAIPELALIIGGHEHDQRFEKIGNIYITKAMANAKSAYILKITINKNLQSVKVKPKVELINEQVALDSTTNVVVQKWVRIANDSYTALGFDANKIVLNNTEPLEGRETEVRSHPTNLTRLIIASLIKAAPLADVVIMNAGSIRVDDILQMPVTQYDLLRSLPFGGGIKEVDIKGSLLIQILEMGFKNKYTGGYLHYNESLQLDAASGKWLLNNTPVDEIKIYRVAFTDFLLTGGEANLGFLKADNKDITKWYETGTDKSDVKADIRKAIISYLNSTR